MSQQAHRPLTILLVENHEDTLTYMRLYLEQQGHDVTAARDVQSALKILRERPIHVLISDIGLPDGDGWELLRRSGSQSSVFGVAMSGYGMNADRERSRAAGYRRHLIKPFLPAELDSILAEAVEELQLNANGGRTVMSAVPAIEAAAPSP